MARRNRSVTRKIKDKPLETKTNRGAQPERRKSRSLPRNIAEEIGPKGPPKGTKSLLKKNQPSIDAPKVNMTTTAPKVDKKVTANVSQTKVTARPKVTGKGSRDVVGKGPMGERRLANVTKEQLQKAGLTTGPQGLRAYLNKYDELGRRPTPEDFKAKKVTRTGSARKMSERKFGGGGKVTMARGSGAARPQKFGKNG